MYYHLKISQHYCYGTQVEVKYFTCQWSRSSLKVIVDYLTNGDLAEDMKDAHKIVARVLHSVLLMEFSIIFMLKEETANVIVSGCGRRNKPPLLPIRCVLEPLLSDRGTNLLSHLMIDVCSMPGITKRVSMSIIRNVKERLSGSTTHFVTHASKNLEHSGIDTWLGFYGHTATLLTNHQ